MLGEIVMIVDCVEGWGIIDRKRWVSVLAVQAFLIAINPMLN